MVGLGAAAEFHGGKTQLLGISKRGDKYLRMLLIHGARSALWHQKSQSTPTQGWLKGLLTRRHRNIAAVALANKNARIVWALLAHGREYQSGYIPAQAAA